MESGAISLHRNSAAICLLWGDSEIKENTHAECFFNEAFF